MSLNTSEHRNTMRSTIDMGRGRSDRPVSKKYIAYLNDWDRRLKKPVAGPSDDATPHPGSINGVRVVRKGKGVPPEADKERLWSTNGRKEVAGKSHHATPQLLSASTSLTADRRTLTADETRTRFTRKVTHRFNQSSLSGGGAIVKDEVSVAYKPWRNPGTNNPGWGLSDNMTKTMRHTCEPDEASLRATRSLAWSVAQRPNTADSIIRHRYDDPTTEATPAKLGSRTMTPALRSVNLDESRSCFLSSLNGYAANKVRGHYGDALKTTTGCGYGLSSLAGF